MYFFFFLVVFSKMQKLVVVLYWRKKKPSCCPDWLKHLDWVHFGVDKSMLLQMNTILFLPQLSTIFFWL